MEKNYSYFKTDISQGYIRLSPVVIYIVVIFRELVVNQRMPGVLNYNMFKAVISK